MLITDVHNHVVPQAVLDLVRSDPAYGVSITNGVWRSPNIDEFPLVEEWFNPMAKLREMDAKRLDRAVLSVAPKPLFYYELPLDKQLQMAELSNQGLAEFVQTDQSRLAWMAHIPAGYPAHAVRVLREAVAAGARGVELGTSAAGRRLDDPAFNVLWEVLEELHCPVFLHPAYELVTADTQVHCLDGVLGLPYEAANAIQRLICGHVLDRYPGLTFVVALGGGMFPYIAGRLRHYSGYVRVLADAPKDPWSYVGQIKFDTHLHDPLALRFLIDKAGAENVMIGTDCSFLSATPDPLDELTQAAGGDEDITAKVANAAGQLFWPSNTSQER